MKRESWTVSDLHLEQYVLGELTARDMKRVAQALAEDELLRARLEEIERSNREILEEYPAERMVPRVRAGLSRREDAPLPAETASEDAAARGTPALAAVPPSRKPRTFTWVVLPAAAAAVLFFSIAAPVYLSRMSSNIDVTRAKGEATVYIHVKTDAGTRLLVDGDLVKAGDILQLSYMSGDAHYGAIFSIDGRGVVTFHLPQGYAGQSQYSPELEHGGEISLSSSYELDNAPGFEKFFIVSSSSRFDVREVEKAARSIAANPSTAANAALKLPRGLWVKSLLLEKQG